MDRINVLHVYQNSKTGGIQQQILNLLKAYDRKLINPVFCCLGPRRELAEEMEALGVEVVALGYERYTRFNAAIIFDLSRVLKEKNIHVLRTHKYRSNFYGRLAARLAHTPVVVASEHNIYIDKELRLGRRTINRLLARWTDQLVAVSEAIRRGVVRFDRIPEEKTMVIHNGAELGRFAGTHNGADIRAEFGADADIPLLGFVGRLVPSKGLNYLLEAMSLIIKRHPSARLAIVGDGALMDKLKTKADSLGINGSIIFTGRRRDVPDILDALNVFVLSSVKEGLPNSIIEAMASGLPIVSSDVGGVGELITHEETGLLVPSKEPESLAQAVNHMLSNPAEASRMAAAARAYALANLSIEGTARTWERLYTSLLQQKGIAFQPMV
jgi:glycosyltransferase involved in cell wall biosynthesis